MAQRVYDRWGPLVLFALVAVGGLTASGLNAAILAYFMHELGADDLDGIGGTIVLAETVALGGALVGFVLARRPLLALVRWSRAGRPDAGADELWRAVTRLPSTMTPVIAASIAVPAGYFVATFIDERAPDADLIWPVLAAVTAGIAANGVFVAYAIGIGLRPIVEDAAGRLPRSFAPDGEGWNLQRRLLAPIPGASVFAGLLVAASTTGIDDPLTHASVGVAVALGTGVVSVALFVVSTRSVLEPIGRLSRATRAVREGDLDQHVALLGSDELGVLTRDFNDMVEGLRERAALHHAFGAYVHPEIADRVMRDGRLPGEQLEVTVLFADIRGFTGLSERSTPQEVVAVLDAFFDTVCPVIEAHGGAVNKLLGDGLLAVFGAPTPREDHADRGVEAARALVRAVWDRFDGGLHVGVGVSSGPVIAGTIGGAGKLDYTLIGDPVNVAARVEQLTKELLEPVLVTGATVALLRHPHDLEPRGTHKVRGRGAAVELYAAAAR